MKRFVLFILFNLLILSTMFGGVEPPVISIYKGVHFIGSNPDPLPQTNIQLPDYTISLGGGNPPWGHNFEIKKLTNKVSLYIDTDATTYIDFPFEVKIPVIIQYADKDLNQFTETVEFSVNYNPLERTTYKQLDLFESSNAVALGFTIDPNTITFSPAGVQNDIIKQDKIAQVIAFRSEIIIERYYHFDPSINLNNNQISKQHLVGSDELRICWDPLLGAEEYELEWKYVDTYPGTTDQFSFKDGAARVRLASTCYQIPLVYEEGELVYRVRGIGRQNNALDLPLYGDWSCGCIIPNCSDDCTISKFVNSFAILNAHENDKLNWQIVTSYAEEGKRKDVVSYFDGKMLNRQSVTGLSTDRQTLVAETMYDYQGRPAIQVLPAPVNNATLQFYRKFNLDPSGKPYQKNNFDETEWNCNEPPDPMSTIRGASHYYSNAYFQNLTPNQQQNTFLGNLPNAGGFPFVHTQWTPDNTGRVALQGGAGSHHHIGYGHETKYYYGAPFQEELDTLFGNDVGVASHYKKNLIIDANGQASVTYLDAKGNTIATSLAGDAPGSLDALPSQDREKFYVDILAFNEVDTLNYALTTTMSFLVDNRSDYEFEYRFTGQQYQDLTCMKANVCYDCIYDLEISLVDNSCNQVIYEYARTLGQLFLQTSISQQNQQITNINSPNNNSSGQNYITYTEPDVSTECMDPPLQFNTNNLPPNDRFVVHDLGVGSYTLYKRLKVNEEAAGVYVKHFLNDPQNNCSQKFNDFLQQELANMNTEGCEIDCGQVGIDLGSSNITNNMNSDDLDKLREFEQDLCDTTSNKCLIAYEAMLADVSPMGQYGEFDIATFNVSAFPLSVFNPSNRLTKPNAHYLNTSLQFLDENGNTVNPNSMLLEDFILIWREEWAEQLVQFHPEYCLYQRCSSEMLPSDDYDALVLATATFQDALTNGFVDYSNLHAIIDNDPYFSYVNTIPSGVDNPGPGGPLKADGISRINVYIPTTNVSMKALAIGLVHCPNDPLNCYQINWSNPITNPVDANEEWTIYKALYLSLKEEIEYANRTDYSINNADCYNGCIGAENFVPSRNGFLDHNWHFNLWVSGSNPYGEYGNPNEPCSHYTPFYLFKDKTKRFPDVYDVLPFSDIDFYNDDPNDIIEELGSQANEEISNECGDCNNLQFENMLNILILNGKSNTFYFTNAHTELLQAFGINSISNAMARSTWATSPQPSYFIEILSNEELVCTFYIGQDYDLTNVIHFCCMQPATNIGYFPITQGASYFTMKAKKANGTEIEVEVYFPSDCYADCGEVEEQYAKCLELPLASELHDLFNYVLINGDLNKSNVTIPNSVLGNTLSEHFEPWIANGDDVKWSGSVTGNKLQVILGPFFKFSCYIEFDFTNVVNTGLGIKWFSKLTPVFSNGSAIETKTFDLSVVLLDGSTVTIPGNISCLPIGKCCVDNPGVVNEGETSPLLPNNEFDPFCDDCPTFSIAGGLLDGFKNDPENCFNPLCEPVASPISIPIENTCEQHQEDIARFNAEKRYNFYLDSLEKATKAAYMRQCLKVTESFVGEFYRSQYHFTLYYYDQANNLVRTVPPNEQVGLTQSEMAKVKNYRKAWREYRSGIAPMPGPMPEVHPPYTQWASTYAYNSLEQIRYQTIPDQGYVSGGQFVKSPSEFFYDELGRLVLSHNPVQAMSNRYSFTRYDAQNRVILVGETYNNGPPINYGILMSEPALNGWIINGDLNEIVETTYDRPFDQATIPPKFPNGSQDYLRSRVSTVARYKDKNDWVAGQYEHATHYSYDLHGNVHTLIQDFPGFADKVVEYKYDLVSGNVNHVDYQRGKKDAFHHYYEYDADNRITRVFTSPDSCIWDRDAAYFYYPHGPMARLELGEDEVQGLDYAYTIHGWLKGMNSGSLQPQHDMGHDGMGLQASSYLHGNFAKDAVGFILSYYEGDYKAINPQASFEPVNAANTQLNIIGKNLYNGNIRNMITAIQPFMDNGQPMGYAYAYDQLNRIKRMVANNKFDPSGNQWLQNSTISDYLSTFSYDPMGNILSLNRNGTVANGNPLKMDELKYSYPYGNNQLGHVDDNPNFTSYYDSDIDDQDPGNYNYDRNGNLIKDVSEGIQQINWNVQGKIAGLSKSNGDKLTFQYDAMGNRVKKKFNNTGTYYIVDGQGNVMAIYRRKEVTTQIGGQTVNVPSELYWESAIIYGHQRLGIFEAEKCLFGCPEVQILNPQVPSLPPKTGDPNLPQKGNLQKLKNK